MCVSPCYLEVFREEQLAGPQEAEDVAEDVAVSVDEVMLLQTVQHDGLSAVKQTTDPAESKHTHTTSSELHYRQHTHTVPEHQMCIHPLLKVVPNRCLFLNTDSKICVET